jgi:hypothetical protein
VSRALPVPEARWVQRGTAARGAFKVRSALQVLLARTALKASAAYRVQKVLRGPSVQQGPPGRLVLRAPLDPKGRRAREESTARSGRGGTTDPLGCRAPLAPLARAGRKGRRASKDPAARLVRRGMRGPLDRKARLDPRDQRVRQETPRPLHQGPYWLDASLTGMANGSVGGALPQAPTDTATICVPPAWYGRAECYLAICPRADVASWAR